eukprot:108873_1
MILAISIISVLSMFTFKLISHMDFHQKSIQIPIHMDHSNQFRHLHPIKSHTTHLNNYLQLSQTSIQKSTKIDQSQLKFGKATNTKWKYGVIDANNNNNAPPPPQYQLKLLTLNSGGNVSGGFGLFDMTKNIQGGGGGIINSDAMRQLVGQQVQ